MLKIPEHQVAGHKAKDGVLGPLVDDSGKFYKPLQNDDRGSTELAFYTSFTSHPIIPDTIRTFFPSFHGTKVLDASDGTGPHPHLVLEDLLHGYTNPSVIDIKVGSRTWYPQASLDYINKCLAKDRESSTVHLGFRISGLKDTLTRWEPTRKSLQNLSVEDATSVLKRFVSSNNDAVSVLPDCVFAEEVFGVVLDRLLELKEWFEDQTVYHFSSCSLLVVYEKDNDCDKMKKKRTLVKLVDFAHVVDGKGVIDHNFLGGLCSFIKFIKDIIAFSIFLITYNNASTILLYAKFFVLAKSNNKVLKWEDVEIGELKEGMEAVGVVTAVGAGLTGRQVGDLVAYAAAGGVGSLLCQWANPLGATVIGTVSNREKAAQAKEDGCHHVIIYIEKRAGKKENVSWNTQAIGLETVILRAGGRERVLQSWKTELETRSILQSNGEDEGYSATAAAVRRRRRLFGEVLDSAMAAAVQRLWRLFDGEEGCSVKGSLVCLKLRGYMVSFGQSSGTPDPVPLSSLAAKSLFLTRPSLMQYFVIQDELLEAVGEVFANVATGVLKVRVNHTYSLSEATKAHKDLENRTTPGSVVLIP
ncbi:hypothetical protein RJT34_01375 [Clitoria ternatea]|uniref:Inositol polyphosphate multikinase n=1 Tax=Clitoria ternatea TaxID=43366 RepID=A0AAN9Q180_CLITE